MSEIGVDLIESCKGWVGSLRNDVATMKAVLTAESVSHDAKKLAAAALNYLVQRMDLVPDHEPTLGVIDDVMVLRVCAALAIERGLDDGLDPDDLVDLAKLSNEAEVIESLMGADLYAHLRKRCERLAEEAVRGRTPERVVTDRAALAQLLQEVEDELARMPPASFGDPQALARQLNSYLMNKLGLA